MIKNFMNQLITDIAEKVMIDSRGFDQDKTKYPLEWDETDPDSQLSMVIDDVALVFESLGYLGYDLTKPASSGHYVTVNGQGTASTNTYGMGITWGTTTLPTTPPEQTEGVTTHVDISISTKKNPTVGDLKEFVSRLAALQVDDETVVSGSIGYKHLVNDTHVERIECGECGKMDYLTYTDEHTCGS